MSQLSISQVLSWRPESLYDIAYAWDSTASQLYLHVDEFDTALREAGRWWSGSAPQAATHALAPLADMLRQLCRALVLAAAHVRDAAETIGPIHQRIVDIVAEADQYHCPVSDDGSVITQSVPALAETTQSRTPQSGCPIPSKLLILLLGGSEAQAIAALNDRTHELTRELHTALDQLDTADSVASNNIERAFDCVVVHPDAVRPAGIMDSPTIIADWPKMSQDRIAAQISTLTAEQRQQLIEQAPLQLGNTDGVPWDMRIAANRITIANAIIDQHQILDRPVAEKLGAAIPPTTDPASAERMWAVLHVDPTMRAVAIAAHDREATQRLALYQDLLSTVTDPLDSRRRIPRHIIGFDPNRESFIELIGDINHAQSLAVLIPGLNTTLTSSPVNNATARQFVTGSGGDIAMITYLGGPFPTGNMLTGVIDAANPRYAEQMAPRLVAFSEDVQRVAHSSERPMPVTYIGHSYGGSILGTAERLGLTADQVIYVQAAGSGVGVHSFTDWNNRNPHVQRFSMTAPGDLIEFVQGFPLNPHGADPDTMNGVITLPTGRRRDGSPMVGPSAHGDVLTEPSDAWHTIVDVITGKYSHSRF